MYISYIVKNKEGNMSKLRMLVGMLCVTVLLFGLWGRAEAQPVSSDPTDPYVKSLLSALTGLVDENLAHVRHTLELLAQCAEVRSGQWDKMQGIIQAAPLSNLPQVVWFVLPDGAYYTSEKGLVSQKLNDRPYFPILMAGQRVMGDLVVSKSTGKKSIIVAVPVQRNGKVIGGVGASIFVDDLSQALNSILKIPDDLVFYGLSPSGLTAFHRDPKLDFVDPREQKSETLKKAAEIILAEKSGEVTYEYSGTTRRMFFTTSPLTGWRIVLGRILGPSSAQNPHRAAGDILSR
jgi:hypothetical protein